MSHFTVAVFHRPEQSVDEILAPYNEQDEQYMEFEPIDEPSEKLHAEYQQNENRYDSFDEFMESYYGCCKNDQGQWGYMSNPNARWDWWQVGGRWSGFLHLKNGESVDEAVVSDIDFSPDREEYKAALRWWEVCVEGKPLEDGEDQRDFFNFYKPEYLIEQYGSKEKYAESRSEHIPWACLTSDGEWMEKGQMGWFATSDATQESRDNFRQWFMDYIEDHPDLVITMVDCHI